MVLKKIHIGTFMVLMLFMTSCEELYIVDCDQCKTQEPSSCLLEIQLGEPPPDVFFDVIIYRGKIEEGVIVANIQTRESLIYQSVALNSEYTVTSAFSVDDIEYTAVDATRPRVDIITDMCEETCYWVYNKRVNLVIKYY